MGLGSRPPVRVAQESGGRSTANSFAASGLQFYPTPTSPAVGMPSRWPIVSRALPLRSELVELPGAKDVSEWAEHNGSRELLIELAQNAEPATKESLEALRARWLPTQGATAETKTGKSTRPDAGKIILTPAADIKPVPIRWLWPGRIARGKLSLLVGHPGVGKSQLALVWRPPSARGGIGRTVRRVSVATRWSYPPKMIPPTQYCRALSQTGQTWGGCTSWKASGKASPRRGAEVRRELCLADDIDKLSAELEKIPDAALVVIDPISAYLGELDSHRDASVRGVLAPLAALAAERRVAVLAIAHLNKNAHADALTRVTGSLLRSSPLPAAPGWSAKTGTMLPAALCAAEKQSGCRRDRPGLRDSAGNRPH